MVNTRRPFPLFVHSLHLRIEHVVERQQHLQLSSNSTEHRLIRIPTPSLLHSPLHTVFFLTIPQRRSNHPTQFKTKPNESKPPTNKQTQAKMAAQPGADLLLALSQLRGTPLGVYSTSTFTVPDPAHGCIAGKKVRQCATCGGHGHV